MSTGRKSKRRALRRDGFKPTSAWDVSDENPLALANQLRALKREVHAGFELVTNKLLTSIERMADKFDDLVDKFDNEIARRAAYEARTDQRLTDAEARLAALEKAKRRKPAKKRK